jgi:esterase/lipase superfamily enzyme
VANNCLGWCLLWCLRWRLIVPMLMVFACGLGAGCATTLAVTPYVMRSPEALETFDQLPESLKTPEMEVLYLTDREQLDGHPEDSPRFGYGRARQLRFGKATVELDPAPSWDELVALSTSGDRKCDYRLKVTRIEPRGVFTPIGELRTIENGLLVEPPSMFERLTEDANALAALVEERLALTERKELVLFIHGFNNSFDDSVIRIAQAWHLAGRQGVPVVYSWPAGSGLLGYGYDRESGEFTIVHLKRVITALGRVPNLERMHIIAHSRGTDVLMTALRELNAEARGLLGTSPYRRLLINSPVAEPASSTRTVADLLKLETVILAAPDLDLDVFAQRVFGENSLGAANRTVIYFSAEDEALAFARWIFGSRKRLGLLAESDLTHEQRRFLASLRNFEMISCEVSGYTTHAYVFQHPAALSDLIRVMRDGARPGVEHGRPLKRTEDGGIWILNNDYLRNP